MIDHGSHIFTEGPLELSLQGQLLESRKAQVGSLSPSMVPHGSIKCSKMLKKAKQCICICILVNYISLMYFLNTWYLVLKKQVIKRLLDKRSGYIWSLLCRACVLNLFPSVWDYQVIDDGLSGRFFHFLFQQGFKSLGKKIVWFFWDLPTPPSCLKI